MVTTQLTGAEHDRIFRKPAEYAANYDAYRGRTDREYECSNRPGDNAFEHTRRGLWAATRAMANWV